MMNSTTVRGGLRKMLASKTFRNSKRLRRMLSFVVEQTLNGRTHTIKEYTIGVEVYEKGNLFDPRTDAIVRVEAIRLRKKLKQYYETEGRHDAVVIALPKGAYVPKFQERSAKGLPAYEQDVARFLTRAAP